MSTVGGLEHPIDPLADAPPEGWVAGRSPWALAGHKLLRNRMAMAALAVFLGIVVVSFMGPFYADHIREMLRECGLESWQIGRVVAGQKAVVWSDAAS